MLGRHAESLIRSGQASEEDFTPFASPSPARLLIETFDYLELCCGPSAPLCSEFSRQGFRTGPKIDLKVHSFWNLQDDRVLAWILFLLRNRRVRHLHSGVPCTTFSVARHPKLRSAHSPWGLKPGDPITRCGNFLLQFVLLCLRIVSKDPLMSGSHEHPDSAFSWKILEWQVFCPGA